MDKQADDMISVKIITEPKTSFPASSSNAAEIEVTETTYTPPVSVTGSTENRTIIVKLMQLLAIFNMMQVFGLFYPKTKKKESWKIGSFHRLSFTEADIIASLMEDRQNQNRRRTNVLPVSRKDLTNTNTTIQQKALKSKSFLSFALQCVHDMSPEERGFILTACLGLLGYLARNSTTPFDDFQSGKTTNPPQSLISPTKAFLEYFKVVAHITTFMICYILTCKLGWKLQPGAQMILVIVLFTTPLIYFPDQIQQASALEVHVACGTFKLPLIGFITLAAVGCSLFCGLVTLSVVYCKWKSLRKGKPIVRDEKVCLDGPAVSEALQGSN